jgi:hypothetical protein
MAIEPRTELGLRIVAAALLLGAAAWVFIAFFYVADAEELPESPGADDPAAYQVAELIEEARKITREAAG